MPNPTWHPKDLREGLERWLAQGHQRQPQGPMSERVRVGEDYRRYQYMLSMVDGRSWTEAELRERVS